MRILLTLLVIAGVVTANNLRGEDETPESRELQTYVGTSRGWGRRTGMALFIVEDDNDRSTTRCADDTADEFEDDFDDIFIVDNDDDAQNGDVVAVIDGRTNCNKLWDDIYEELDKHEDHSTTTVYVYYGSGRKYYRNRYRGRGYRLYSNRKNNRSGKYWGGDWGRNRRRSRNRRRKSDGGRNRYHHDHKWGGGDKKWSGGKDKNDDHDHDHDHNWGGGDEKWSGGRNKNDGNED